MELSNAMTQEERDLAESARESMVDAILTARDFCGNQFEAFVEVCHESNIEPSVDLFNEVAWEAEVRWSKCRAAARAS